ncbi:core [Tibetan frog hepatitis B virus]|uniref:Core n=1 Tax=Tibetan frog hepatitis B virus TaxID=2169919 RepID=A0A193AUV5_9HEPA|nr:core [Tibetan frog hepatitis B virus]ANN02856.1 core [Tibetan frog hepatitis B virus]
MDPIVRFSLQLVENLPDDYFPDNDQFLRHAFDVAHLYWEDAENKTYHVQTSRSIYEVILILRTVPPLLGFTHRQLREHWEYLRDQENWGNQTPPPYPLPELPHSFPVSIRDPPLLTQFQAITDRHRELRGAVNVGQPNSYRELWMLSEFNRFLGIMLESQTRFLIKRLWYHINCIAWGEATVHNHVAKVRTWLATPAPYRGQNAPLIEEIVEPQRQRTSRPNSRRARGGSHPGGDRGLYYQRTVRRFNSPRERGSRRRSPSPAGRT